MIFDFNDNSIFGNETLFIEFNNYSFYYELELYLNT